MHIQSIESNYSPSFLIGKSFKKNQNMGIKNSLNSNVQKSFCGHRLTSEEICKAVMDDLSIEARKDGYNHEDRKNIEDALRQFKTSEEKYRILIGLVKIGRREKDPLTAEDIINYLTIMSDKPKEEQFAMIKIMAQKKIDGADTSVYNKNFAKLNKYPELITVAARIERYLNRDNETAEKADKNSVLSYTFDVISENPELFNLYPKIADKLMDGKYLDGLLLLAQNYTKEEVKFLMPDLDEKLEAKLINKYDMP